MSLNIAKLLATLSQSASRFVGIDLGCEPVPDATTMLRFRRLLNANKLGEALFARVGKELLARCGLAPNQVIAIGLGRAGAGGF